PARFANRYRNCAARSAEILTNDPDWVQTRGLSNTATIRGDTMNSLKIAGLLLVAAGILGLIYGGFTYTKDTHEAKIGPFEMAVKEKETVNIPVWAGIGAIILGGVLLVGGRKT
ncbi:MAG: hypothetical protein ABSF86_22690, partial [Steroidobacteraceae bacterium]